MQHDSERKQLRTFGVLVGGIFAVLGLWPAMVRGAEVRLWGVGVAVVLIVPALVHPRSLRWPYRLWMALGQGLGWLNTRIILSLVFYGLFTPIGWVRRLRGQDAMQRRFEPDATTYRVVRSPRPSAHMTRQF
jgi:saxitoxin biosynthesis operon SxtJ-like protein